MISYTTLNYLKLLKKLEEKNSNRLLWSLACLYAAWVGDRYCDDNTNTEECNFDGGDCCGPDKNNQYCKECQCIEGGRGKKTCLNL